MDQNRNPLPDGHVGEICVGGPGVALGYINLPEKTADRFIQFDGARIYRTGDLGRIDDDGEVVYMGRADDEVKIRGHRVDLGEIETLLLDDVEVESAVAAMMPVGGADELVAFVTRQLGATRSEDPALILRLRDRLRDKVPDYMIPGYFEVLPTLPTMPSGKVDRRKLPTPSGSRLITTTGEVVAAVGVMEEQVRDAWAATFGLETGRSVGHRQLLRRPRRSLAAGRHLRLTAAGARRRGEPSCSGPLQQSDGSVRWPSRLDAKADILAETGVS